MPKSVVFHLGLPKTGSTTLQNYLRSQDEKLRSLGFLYPGEKEHPVMNSFKHLLVLSAMLGNEPDKSGGLDAQGCRTVVENVFTQFRDSDFDTLIWSHEGISSRALGLDVNYVRKIVEGLDVRFFIHVRYIDDWVESIYKERLRAQGGKGKGRSERRTPRLKPKRLIPLSPPPVAATREAPRKSMLEEASEIPGSLRALREILPAAQMYVESFDAHRDRGTVVSGALAAMGVPVARTFAHADDDAGVRNPTKSNLYSMLVYHLVLGGADADVVRAVTVATKRRMRAGLEFEPLRGRHFRFLSEEHILDARGYYENLRQDYPHLPAQPPHEPDPAERNLPEDDGVALLDWLRPDLSDADFARARAAYTLI